MVEQNESITRLYRIGHTEIEITAPLSMKSPRNLEKFRTGQAKRTDDEVIHYQVEMTENLDEIKEDLLGKKTGRVIYRDNLTVFQTSGGECRFINFLGMDWHYAVSSQEGANQYHVWFVPEVAEMLDQDTVYLAAFSLENRDPDADRGRSDSMMMVSFNKKEGKSTAISFLRDSLVDIDGHGKSRLGHTYAYGGVGLTINTINKTYDLDIQNYITISFDDLVNVIDEIGGVTVFISEEEAAYYRENGMPDIQAGDVTLTGSQALAHARNRTLGNDFERTRRQRSVMYGIYRKIMEKKDPSALLPLINYAVNHVRTNMSVSEMYSMAKDVLSVDDLKMQQTCIPQDGTYTDITYEGMQVLKVDFDANKKKIEQLLY